MRAKEKMSVDERSLSMKRIFDLNQMKNMMNIGETTKTPQEMKKRIFDVVTMSDVGNN